MNSGWYYMFEIIWDLIFPAKYCRTFNSALSEVANDDTVLIAKALDVIARVRGMTLNSCVIIFNQLCVFSI